MRTATSAYALAIALTGVAMGFATRGGEADLSWHSIDGGGGRSDSGDLIIVGTIGQPDAGAPLVAGDLALVGGFWPAPGTVPPPPACPADIDGSGDVGFNDLLAVLAAWGVCDDCPEDVTGEGLVDFDDLLLVLAAWGPCA